MLPPPLEHRFTLEGETYCLTGWTRGGERRIHAQYALALGPQPATLEAIDGGSLYDEAVAAECLREAPDYWWTQAPPAAGSNGLPQRVFNCDRIPAGLWRDFREEVAKFLAKIFQRPTPDVRADAPAGAGDPPAMAAPEALAPGLRGRAE
jgi:hypothetical protein